MMIDFGIKIPDMKLDAETSRSFRAFLQWMVYRRVQGACRYGDRPKASQKYLTRMTKELKAYRKTGNFEHLLNIAVYCFLESFAPQHPKFHFDPTAASVTRKEIDDVHNV